MALVQVGIIALRAPDGSFLPSTPIYKDLPVNERGRTAQEEKATVAPSGGHTFQISGSFLRSLLLSDCPPGHLIGDPEPAPSTR